MELHNKRSIGKYSMSNVKEQETVTQVNLFRDLFFSVVQCIRMDLFDLLVFGNPICGAAFDIEIR